MIGVALAFSAVLALAAIMVAILAARIRPAARDYLRFSSLLYAALALAGAANILWPGDATASFCNAITFLVCALAPASLALALFAGFEHPPSQFSAIFVLVIALLAGIAAAAFGFAVLSFAPLSVSVLTILALAARRWRHTKRDAFYAILSAVCLTGGAASVMARGMQARTALLLFSTSALLGMSLALVRCSEAAVEEQRREAGFASAIRGQR